MSVFIEADPAIEELKARQQFWVDYYKERGVDFNPTAKDNKNIIKWSRMNYDLTLPDEDYRINNRIKFLLSEFEILNKNIHSYSQAVDYWIGVGINHGIKIKMEDVSEAYNLAYGYGSEFEFTDY